MPLKPKTIEKIYWTIGEVAEEIGVATSSIRFWEKELGSISTKRTNRGDRLYTRKEIEQIKTIQNLVRNEGFTLNGARAQLSKPVQESRTIDLNELRQRLHRIRKELMALQKDRSH